jgi:hypothetical protein
MSAAPKMSAATKVGAAATAAAGQSGITEGDRCDSD